MPILQILAVLVVLLVAFIEYQAHKNHVTVAAQLNADLALAKADLAELKTKVAVLVSHNPTSAPAATPQPIVAPPVVVTPTPPAA